jgi:rare lipoprotein A
MHRPSALYSNFCGRFGALLLGLLLLGCATAQHTGTRGLPQKRGTASYYADKFVGRPTANGEVFSQKGLTAAHRTLPFDTRVRATRIDVPSRPSVVVRINDRGPFKDNRIIDLSKSAARQLRMLRDGLAEVELDVLSYPSGAAASSPGAAPSDSAQTEEAQRIAW